MFKLINILLFFFLIITSCNKNKNTVNGFLWEIKKGDGITYIYGANYIAKEKAILDKRTKEALNSSNIILAEFDFIKHSKIINKLVSKNYYTENGTLKKILAPKLYKKVYQKYKEYGYSDLGIDRLSLYGAAMGLRNKKNKKLGYVINNGFYNKIIIKSHDYKKKIIEFSDPESYFDSLCNVTKESQIFILNKVLNTSNKITKELLQQCETYRKNGDIENFIIADNKLCYHKDLEVKLNFKIELHVAKIVDLCLKREKRCFVLEGSTILTDKNNNIIKVLKSKGYNLERIKY